MVPTIRPPGPLRRGPLHLACLALAAACLAAQAQPTLELAQGRLVGKPVGGVDAYLGIPYAAPPVGEARWRPPGAAPHWAGARDARVAGNDCPQPINPATIDASGRPQSEDCLYLNVWTPRAEPKAAPRPVLVWIHGGGFVLGSGARGMTDGSALARRGLVVVSLNYRLGRLGFLAHPVLTAENPAGLLANFGLQDQIAALQWVRRNIARFGGDPGNVTLMGESAGGASVNHLLGSPMARGLVHKAIVQSGGGRVIPPAVALHSRIGRDCPRDSAELAGEEALRRRAIAPGTAAELRAVPLSELALPHQASSSGTRDFPGVIVDGRLVRETVQDAFVNRRAAPVPYLIGVTDAEALLAMTPQVLESALTYFGPRRAAVEAAYGDAKTLMRELGGDIVFTEPARLLARAMRDQGAPVWVYRFGYLSQALQGRLTGVPHGYSLPYFFDRLSAAGLPDHERDAAVARMMADFVAAFAKRGDPNAPGHPAWRRFDDEEHVFHVGNDRIGSAPDSRAARLDLIEQAASAAEAGRQGSPSENEATACASSSPSRP